MSPIHLIALDLALLAAAVGAAFKVRQTAFRDLRIISLLAAPGLAMLALFYSLAIHMHTVLNGWPAMLGTRGLPSRLFWHAEFASSAFDTWVFFLLFVWPVAFLACLLVQQLRKYLLYTGVHALAFLVCLGAMLLAPSRYLDWWWD